ncbi:MAG TPA: hypothetical protein VGQ89_08155 [Candidatus Limnocylindrales bacterium]|jgi:hypothetical protein|nr:hypothetical protein [Candidatus Limnocylindrales bacterium]
MTDLDRRRRARESEATIHSRRPRPILVELASAFLVIGGALSVLMSVETVARMAGQGRIEASVALISLIIGAASVALGLLLRAGRAWLIGVNLIAVAGFLELTSGTIVGLLYGAIDVFVVVALVATREWFRQPLTPPTASPPTR